MGGPRHWGFSEKRKEPRKEKFKASEYLKGREKQVKDSLDKLFGPTPRKPLYNPWAV